MLDAHAQYMVVVTVWLRHWSLASWESLQSAVNEMPSGLSKAK